MLLAIIDPDGTVACRLCSFRRSTASSIEGERRARQHLNKIHARIMVSSVEVARGQKERRRVMVELHGPRWKNDMAMG